MKSSIVYGVGINDADYQVARTLESGEWRCPYYKTWKNMLARCYSKAYLKQDAKREGSQVDERWHSFMAFREWMMTQDWEGNYLDKDLLVQGNMNYSPDTCLFVTPTVNGIISTQHSLTGYRWVYPNGNGWRCVYRTFDEKGTHKIISMTFKSVDQAIQLANAKYKEALMQLSKLQKDHRVSEALVRRSSMITPS